MKTISLNVKNGTLLIAFTGILFAGFILLSQVVNAQPAPPITWAQANAVCDRKADKAACLAEIRKCPRPPTANSKSKCLREAVSKGGAGTSTEFNLDAKEKAQDRDACGGGENEVKTSFDFGCSGRGRAIEDLAFAIIRFMSIGVGLVLTASLIYAGIAYSASEGNPEKTADARRRIINTVIGLIFYLLIFALIQYLVPGGLFNG